MTGIEVDVAVIGAGMAGVSLAARTAGRLRTLVIEAEDQPGRHATGRSAAMYFESYGAPVVRALTRASRDFLFTPPPGFSDETLVRARGVMMISDAAGVDELAAQVAAEPALEMISPQAALQRVPILRPDGLAAAAFSERGYDIDVAALLQGYMKTAKRAGAQFVFGSRDLQITREGGRWRLQTQAMSISAPVLVNAAGAWAEEIGLRCGAAAQGLTPLRRSAFLTPPPEHEGFSQWPLVIDAAETVYFKPEASQLLVSPANEDVSPSCDAAPEDMDIALAVDRFETVTTHPIRRITHRWAGLRTFAPDRRPVVGYDPSVEGLFWLAGQGGYGIQMADALSRLACAMLINAAAPEDILSQGVGLSDLKPRAG